MKKKETVWTYHKWHSLETKDGDKFKMITQFYQVGIYAIINNDSSLQFNYQPSDLVRMEKKFQKGLKSGEIKSLEFGPEISVTTVDGLFSIVEQKYE